MLSNVLKNLSILKKFLFINSVVFIIIGCGTIFYLETVQPNLIKKKAANHIQIIDNTLNHIQRLNVDVVLHGKCELRLNSMCSYISYTSRMRRKWLL